MMDGATPNLTEMERSMAGLLARRLKSEALALAKNMAENWPNQWVAQRCFARAQLANGALEEAFDTYRHCEKLFPDKPEIALALSRLHLQRNERDEAVRALARAEGLKASEVALLSARVALATHDKDWAALEALNEAQLAFAPENTRLWQSLARARLRLGKWPEAEVAVNQWRDLEPDAPQLFALMFEVAAHAGDGRGLSDAVEAAAKYSSGAPDFPNFWGALNQLESRQLALDTLKVAAQAWPEHPAVRAGMARANLPELSGGDSEQDAYGVFERAYKLAVAGQVQAAVALVASLPSARSPEQERQRAFRVAALRRLPEPSSLLRPVVEIWENSADVVQSEPCGFPTTAIVFTGLAGRAFFPLSVFDMYLSELGMNAIYLRDDLRLLYCRGISSLGPDLAATLDGLRARLDALGTSRLVTIGSSAGGFGAINYGVELGAERIVGFSSPTDIRTEFLRAVGDARALVLTARLNRQFPPRELMCRERIEAAGYTGRITLHYGADMPTDRAHAEQLAGLAGVSLRPEPGCDQHGLIPYLMAEGRLSRVLRNALLQDTAD